MTGMVDFIMKSRRKHIFAAETGRESAHKRYPEAVPEEKLINARSGNVEWNTNHTVRVPDRSLTVRHMHAQQNAQSC